LGILKKHYAQDEDLAFYSSFLDLLYSVFRQYTNNLNEYIYLSKTLFPFYVSPTLSGKSKFILLSKLFFIQILIYSLFSSKIWES